ncbi:MAG: hypothetical protein ABIB71_03175 [Candidatus Woesearchaeota archaeon]
MPKNKIPGKEYLLAAAAAFAFSAANASAQDEKKESIEAVEQDKELNEFMGWDDQPIKISEKKDDDLNVWDEVVEEIKSKPAAEEERNKLAKKGKNKFMLMKTKESLGIKDGLDVKLEGYGTNGYGGISLDTGHYSKNLIIGANFEVGSTHNNLALLKASNLKAGYMNHKGFIGLQGGMISPNEQLVQTKFAKLQAGTTPGKRDSNFLASFIFMNSPKLAIDSINRMTERHPYNLVGLSLRYLLGKEKVIDDNWKFIINMDSVVTGFLNVAQGDYLNWVLENSTFNATLGDPSGYTLSHWFTKMEWIFQHESGVGIGLYNDVDIAALLEHNHGLMARVRTDKLNLDFILGARLSHSMYIDDVGHDYKTFFYKHNDDLFARVNLSWLISNNAYFKAYADMNFTSDFYRAIGIFGVKANDFNIEAKVSYDNYFGGLVAMVGLSWNFDKSNKLIDPKEERFYTEEIESMKPTFSRVTSPEKNPERLHEHYGPTFEDALKKINSLEDALDYMSHFHVSLDNMVYSFYDVSAEEIHQLGEGHCEMLGGVMWVELLEHLGYDDVSYTIIVGAGINHVIARAKDGTVVIADYGNVFVTGEKNLERAVMKVYPEAFIIDGRRTPTAEHIMNITEKPMFFNMGDYFK